MKKISETLFFFVGSTKLKISKSTAALKFAPQKYVWKQSLKTGNFAWLQLKNSLSVLLQDCHFSAAI